MLGVNGNPSILVEVTEQRATTDFNFNVINGSWSGVFYNGHITILDNPSGAWTDLGITEILCDNQDRLRGDYNDVFDNFHNPDYIAPKPKKIVDHSSWDDEIPF